MRKEIQKSNAYRLINPGGVILVTSCYKDKANIITLAWFSPISRDPALVGIAIAKTHVSYELIKKSEEFIINIPNADIIQETMACGKVHGDKVDKFKESKLTAEKAERLTKTPRIKECIAHIECSLHDVRDMGDHGLFVGEVIYASVEEGLFEEVWNPEKAKLLFHLGGNSFMIAGKVVKV